MEGRSIGFEIKVGIFVFIGIIIMFIIVFSIGELYILKPTYRIRSVFGFANGIEMGSPVRLAGVDIGEIENIRVYYDETLQRTMVMLVAKIKKEAKVEKDAAFRINTLGLLGEKYMEITPGTVEAGFLEDQEIVRGYDPVPMEEVTKRMNELSEAAKAATESASAILARIENGEGTIGKLLTEEKIYNDLEDFVADIKAHPWKLLVKGKERSKDTRVPVKEEYRGFAR